MLIKTISTIFTRVCVFFLFTAGMTSVVAQTGQEEDHSGQRLAHNAFYVEIFGQGVLYSLNYDYRLSDHVSLRAGFSSWTIPAFPFITSDLSFTGFPLMLSYLSGDGSDHLELGVGIIPVNASTHGSFFGESLSGSTSLILETGTIGYRLQPREGGFVFRIGLVPFLNSSGLRLSGGLSLGGAF